MSSTTESEIFAPLDRAIGDTAEAWSVNDELLDETGWDTEEGADWEFYPAEESHPAEESYADEAYPAEEVYSADEVLADEEYDSEHVEGFGDESLDTEWDETTTEETYPQSEYSLEASEVGELDTYHRSRRHAAVKPRTTAALNARIARIAEHEYRRWHPHGRKPLVEDHPDATPILQEYYRTGVGDNISARQLQSKAWQSQHPWSAVFVSWVMRKAGAGKTFAYSRGHQGYIRAAKKNRLTANTASPFWAFRATEIAPQVGDLVCRARANSGATYENIGERQRRNTHCDIVTQVRPGEIRVIGGNVHQNVDTKTLHTLPDGRLKLDGKQAPYFAVIRCNATAAPLPAPSPRPAPRPAPAPGPGNVRAGQHVVDRLPMLAGHAGTHPDLVLKWNDMMRPSAVDVVVHLHGWADAGVGGRLNIVRQKLPVSGLDFADPANPAHIGRTTPTLMVLPRGHHDPAGRDDRRYTFPALTKPGALQRLIEESLAIFAAQTGVPVRQNRLIVTAHSGGGAPLMQILGHTNPDEVHEFDALYTDPAPLIAWAHRRIGSGTGALRIVYRPGEGTAANSRRVAHAVSAARSPRFRAESTTVAHGSIPPRFGWRLLADPSADLPNVTVSREVDTEYDFEMPQESGEADLECPSFSEFDGESDWGEAYPVDEWSEEADEPAAETAAEPAGELLDEYDEDHAEETAVHDQLADEDELTDEARDDESGDPPALSELMDIGLTGEYDESASLDEATDVEAGEFGGSEHKHIGDRASGGADTTIRYGSPPQWLSFGDVVALAGDYFPTYFDLNDLARTPQDRMELAWARWRCLGLKGQGVAEPPATREQQKRVTDRYFLLASRNLSHFSAGGSAIATYAQGHSDALVDALQAGQTGDKAVWRRALTKEAFADHFLTDSFSAGHVRTPRAAIKQWYGEHMPGSSDALLRYMARRIFDRLAERQQLPPVVWWYGWISRLWGNELLKADITKTGGEATNNFSVGDVVSLAIHNYDNKGLDVVSAVDVNGHKVAGGYRWQAVGDNHLGVKADAGTRSHADPCAPKFSPASEQTSRMATAAVIASLRDLERVRGIGVKLGNKPLSRAQQVQAIKQGSGSSGFAALQFVPREDTASHMNVPLSSHSGSTPLDWRWGRLGEVAYKAVDETVKCQIASELAALIPSVADPAVANRAGMTFPIYGTRDAFRVFVDHLRAAGITAIENAVGKPAR